MSGDIHQPLFHGIIPPLATPLKEQDAIDQAGLERLINHVVQGGVNALFILGTTGEAPSLSRDLRLEMVRSSCKITAQRVPVLVGITDTSYTETVRLGCAAAEAGAAGLVVAPPYYFLYTQEDLIRYVERLAADLPLPILLYNIPQFTKVAFAVETVQRASQIPRVVAIKDSSGDLEYLAQLSRGVRHRRDFGVFIGPEEKLVDGMQAGACGGVCGGANLFPRLFVEIYHHVCNEDWKQARRLQNLVREISAAIYNVGDSETSYLRGLKAALASKGICSDLVAFPFAIFSQQEREILEAELLNLGSADDGDPAIARLLAS
jgi:4-hydroxy-tetrahydrodipicolinate synthase